MESCLFVAVRSPCDISFNDCSNLAEFLTELFQRQAVKTPQVLQKPHKFCKGKSFESHQEGIQSFFKTLDNSTNAKGDNDNDYAEQKSLKFAQSVVALTDYFKKKLTKNDEDCVYIPFSTCILTTSLVFPKFYKSKTRYCRSSDNITCCENVEGHQALRHLPRLAGQ